MNLTPNVLGQVLKVIAMLIVATLLVSQFMENLRLRRELALSKSREKPKVMVVSEVRNGKSDYYIWYPTKDMYWSSAGFTPNEGDARQFSTRGLAKTFAENMNCTVVN